MVLDLSKVAIAVELVATEVVIAVHDLGPEVSWHLLRRPGS